MFRLRQKHSPNPKSSVPPADGHKLVSEQSVYRGVAGSIVVALLLCWVWALLSMRTGRVFPWFSIVIGTSIGISMQRFGRGLDWRFPVLALIIAGIAAYFGNLLIGALETGRYIQAELMHVMRGLSLGTIRNFFIYTVGPVDHIYAFAACGLAAFFAKRRLKRHEVLGLWNIRKRH